MHASDAAHLISKIKMTSMMAMSLCMNKGMKGLSICRQLTSFWTASNVCESPSCL